MADCPNQECHTNVQGIRKTLYGGTGSGGLVSCVSKKISTNLAIAFLAFTLTFSGGFILYGLAAERKQNEKVAEIEVVKKDIENIKEDVSEIKEAQSRMEMRQRTIIDNQIKPDVLKLLIKEAVRDGGS